MHRKRTVCCAAVGNCNEMWIWCGFERKNACKVQLKETPEGAPNKSRLQNARTCSLERRIVENNAFYGVLRGWYVDMLNKVSKVHRLRYTSSETITKCGFGAGLNAKILAKLSLTKHRKELEKQPITARSRASSQQATSTQ